MEPPDPRRDGPGAGAPAAELVRGPDGPRPLAAASPREAEPPVVARLVVEIRSDGSRTIARGAVEDVASGERVALEATGGSPLQLAAALARSLTQLPRLSLGAATRTAVRGLLGRGRRER